ncbi:MAG: hypothetical protein ACRDI2_18425, partial [Chloroflexota bacterium]
MGSAEPPVPPVPRRSAPPRRSVPPSGDELLVGATIQTHDLSGGPPAGDTGHSGALAPAQPSPPGLSGEWQRLRVYGGGALLLLC